jgi:hypothetical protein
MFGKIFSRNKVDADILFALKWKKPNTIQVIIKKTDQGYFAKVTSINGNVVTQADNGIKLVEMVNEAVYDFLDIPVQYRSELGYFMPPENVREEFKLGIPAKYLNTTIGLVTA